MEINPGGWQEVKNKRWRNKLDNVATDWRNNGRHINPGKRGPGIGNSQHPAQHPQGRINQKWTNSHLGGHFGSLTQVMEGILFRLDNLEMGMPSDPVPSRQTEGTSALPRPGNRLEQTKTVPQAKNRGLNWAGVVSSPPAPGYHLKHIPPQGETPSQNEQFGSVCKCLFRLVQLENHSRNWKEMPGSLKQRVEKFSQDIKPPLADTSYKQRINAITQQFMGDIIRTTQEHLEAKKDQMEATASLLNPTDVDRAQLVAVRYIRRSLGSRLKPEQLDEMMRGASEKIGSMLQVQPSDMEINTNVSHGNQVSVEHGLLMTESNPMPTPSKRKNMESTPSPRSRPSRSLTLVGEGEEVTRGKHPIVLLPRCDLEEEGTLTRGSASQKWEISPPKEKRSSSNKPPPWGKEVKVCKTTSHMMSMLMKPQVTSRTGSKTLRTPPRRSSPILRNPLLTRGMKPTPPKPPVMGKDKTGTNLLSIHDQTEEASTVWAKVLRTPPRRSSPPLHDPPQPGGVMFVPTEPPLLGEEKAGTNSIGNQDQAEKTSLVWSKVLRTPPRGSSSVQSGPPKPELSARLQAYFRFELDGDELTSEDWEDLNRYELED